MVIEVKTFIKNPRIVGLIIALVLGFSLTWVSRAHSSESTAQQKALLFLNEVVGLDMASYDDASLRYDHINDYPCIAGHLCEDICYDLASKQSLSVSVHFVDNIFEGYTFDSLDGYGISKLKTSDLMDAAKNFLMRYQTYSGATHCDMLRQILNTVDASKNSTISSGNVEFQVSVLKYLKYNSTSFYWKYVYNGIEAQFKSVSLRFQDGFLDQFFDDWGIYKIGSTSINVSEEDAINTTLRLMKNYKGTVVMGNEGNITVELAQANITKIQTKLEFAQGRDHPRGGDGLMLYPRWKIMLYFDKEYPGGMYGYGANIWADTGEVMYAAPGAEYGSTPISSNTNPVNPTMIVALVSVPAVLFTILQVHRRRKKPSR
jgi:hypothetical protein